MYWTLFYIHRERFIRALRPGYSSWSRGTVNCSRFWSSINSIQSRWCTVSRQYADRVQSQCFVTIPSPFDLQRRGSNSGWRSQIWGRDWKVKAWRWRIRCSDWQRRTSWWRSCSWRTRTWGRTSNDWSSRLCEITTCSSNMLEHRLDWTECLVFPEGYSEWVSKVIRSIFCASESDLNEAKCYVERGIV